MADLVSDIWNGLRVLKVRNEAAEAVIALHGAHVLSYKPAGEREVLWLSQKSWHEAGKPIRGGIPVCWPWFGPAQEPPHGVARLTEWALRDSVSETGKSVISFEAFAYEDRIAELTVTVADTLRLELTTTNLSADEFRLTEAFHSYFAVSDVTRIRISGLDKAEYLDTLTGLRHIQEEDIRFSAETDRIYDSSSAECVIHDPAYAKAIHVRKEGSLSTVVWNPWIAKSRRMPDFGDDEYLGMVCVETANAGKDFRILKQGDKQTLAMEIALQ